MNFQGRKRRKIAILMLFAVIFMNLFPSTNGENSVIITPMETTAYAADVTIAPGMFGMEVDSKYRPNGSLIKMDKSEIPIAIAHSSNSIPSGATVEWLEYDHDVIQIVSATDYKVIVKAVGPGYSQFAAIVRYNGMAYQVYCEIYVPLQVDSSDGANTKDNGYGMIGNLHYGDGSDNVSFQLSTVPATGGAFERTHYLIKLKNVAYKSGVTNNTIASPSAITVSSPAITWTSGNEKVATVDSAGIITAVGAGYTEIKVETTTSYNEKKDSIKIPVFVSPIGQVSTSSDPMKNEISFTATSNTFTINTNAIDANNLIWTIHKGDSPTGTVINPDKSDLLDLSLSKYSGAATFTNVKAGKYYITARPTDKFSEGNSGIKELRIHVDVPVYFSHDKITMTVGDYYDIVKNSNLPDKNWYNYVPINGTIVEVSAGVITAKQNGNTTVTMTAQPAGVENGATNKTLDVTVVDGINLNTTAATIYVGSSLQLILNASNNAAPITWTSSDPSIAMVDEDGKVTGQKAGDCVITVKQVINGVTKSLKCNVKVIASVTKIDVDPITKDIAIGDNLTINATATPKINNLKLVWVTSDEKVVKISSAGDMSATVTGVAGGTAVISAINKDNIVVGSCLVKVYQPIESITLSETDVKVPLSDKSFQLYATILPASAKEQEVIWKSTDPSIATVDADGTVTVKKPGTASIIATSKVNANISAICKVTVMKAVSGITLDHTQRAMYVGETYRLTYTIKPADSTNTAVVWSSSNTSIATVNNEGLVTAKSVGTAVIILKTADGGHMATCTLTISRTATAVKLDVTKLTMNVGDYYYLETKLTPADSTETTLTWESSEPKIATVSKSGKVIAKSAGKTIIMVKTKSGSTGYCTVTVHQPVTGIQLSSDEETISIGEKLELEANVLPAKASDTGVSWESSNTDVATVNDKGEVKGIAGGVTMISATSDDGNYKDYCMVTVEELVTSIKLNHTSYRLGLGRSITLTAKINGERATNKQLQWSSSNKKIVSVDSKGRIKGLKLGTATITASATDDSGVEATCFVRVCRLVTSIDLNTNYITLVQGKSYNLKATVSPSNATFKTPVYSSNKKSIAIVDKKGTITALSPGDAIVTVKANDSSGVKSLCYVRVIAPVASTSVSISESEVVMSPGETKTVAISIVPNNSTDGMTWSSDNQLVATVGAKSGKITAKAIGTANITVMTESGRKGTIKVYVVGLSKTSITLPQYTSTLISLQVDGAGASSLKPRWDVENQEVATVVNGKVTAKALGTTYVYAVVNGRRLTCKVTVTKIP